MNSNSRASQLVEQLRPLGHDVALRVARAMWSKLPLIERAALTLDEAFWAPRCSACGQTIAPQ